MKLTELKTLLEQNSEKRLRFVLPTGTSIPLHAHVTDIARVDKKYMDCGGTLRNETLCRLQTWFADDTEHRIGCQMLLKVLGKAATFLETDDLEVDVEYEAPFVSHFPITSGESNEEELTLRLCIKHTACLAEDRCLPPKKPEAASVLFRQIKSIEPAKCC